MPHVLYPLGAWVLLGPLKQQAIRVRSFRGGGGGCGSQASEFRRLPTASGLDTLENHLIWVLVGYNFSYVCSKRTR